MRWTLAHKFHSRCVALADRHYSRQKLGTPQFCRPGYNLTLYARDQRGGEAVFNWWRPRWDVGRKDGLRAIECTIFRNETEWLSSELVVEAAAAVQCWERMEDGVALITSVNSVATRRRRSRRHLPGHCFRVAGWVDLEHSVGRADVWLLCPPNALPSAQAAGGMQVGLW